MRLLEASIRGFGKLVEREFRFAPGVQIVVGDNESGKSTLQKFLLAMLFGLKREDRRRREYLPEYERCRPWSGAAYSGRLVYDLESGERFEVLRVFERREESLRLLDAITGRERTAEFPLDERKERPFMQRQIQLSRRLFEATTAMGQLAGPPALGGVGALRARIQGLLDSGDEQMSAPTALTLLAQMEERMGSERTPSRGLGLLLRERRSLQEELDAARARQMEILDLHARREAVARDYAAQSQAWAENRRAEHERERAQLLGRLHRLQTLEDECATLRRRLEQFADVATVDVAAYAPARERAAGIATLAASLAERRARWERGRERAQVLGASETRLAAALGGLDRARVQELLRQAEHLRENLGRLRGARARYAEEQRRNRGIVDRLRRHHGRDWTRDEFLGELAAQRQRARGGDAEVRRAEAEAAAAAYRARRGSAAWFGLVALAAVSALTLGAVLAPSIAPLWVRAAALAAVMAAAAGVCLTALRQVVVGRDLARSLAVRAALGEQDQHAAAEWLEGVLERNGVQNLAEIEQARRDYETLRAEAERISAPGGRELVQLETELSGRAAALHREVQRSKAQALRTLQEEADPAALQLLPFAEEESTAAAEPEDSAELHRLVEALRSLPQLRRSCAWLERLREERGQLEQQNEASAAELEAQAARLEGEKAALAASLQQHGAADLEDFAARVARAGERQALLAALESWQREQRGVLGGESVETLQARAAELEAALALGSGAAAPETVGAFSPASLEEVARDKDRLAAEQAQLEERLAAREKEGRLPAEIELRLQEVEAQSEIERRRAAALHLATETLQQVATSLHREAAPRMNDRVGQLFARLSLGTHSQVRLDEDLTPRVRMDGDGMFGVEALSGGAADQLYFALRVTAGEILARDGERLPLLLDDPFVQYDPDRLQAALELVAELAREHQVFFYTCESVQAEALAARLQAQRVDCATLVL